MKVTTSEINQGDKVYLTLVHYTSGLNKPQKILSPTLCTCNESIREKVFLDSKGCLVKHRTTDGTYVGFFTTIEEAQEQFYEDLVKAIKLIEHDKEQVIKKCGIQLDNLNKYVEVIIKDYPEVVI